ncbi:hypothetical protein [Chroococcidiopsis sp.]|uniref:hypothetical protein n=1 Tax=Chroococcidiopsis sp. TaxID=3088168 RepID=UPI003F337F65
MSRLDKKLQECYDRLLLFQNMLNTFLMLAEKNPENGFYKERAKVYEKFIDHQIRTIDILKESIQRYREMQMT